MANSLSVIIPCYNPNFGRLGQTLAALKTQTLTTSFWELIVVDNNSSNNFTKKLDLGWHPHAKIVEEPKQGLTFARIKGFLESSGDIILMVDDDNVPQADYLENVLGIFENYPGLGAAGGKSIPLFEVTPPDWLKQFYSNLALRDLGNDTLINTWQNEYPAAAPIGAGMAIKRLALLPYIEKNRSADDLITDRTPSSLASGGDNEIVIEVLKSGWQVGYFPELSLQHIIPRERMQAKYLAKLIKDTNKSWVQLLGKHGINPWKKISQATVGVRKLKAFFAYTAWSNPASFIRWKGACGLYEGLAKVYHAKTH